MQGPDQTRRSLLLTAPACSACLATNSASSEDDAPSSDERNGCRPTEAGSAFGSTIVVRKHDIAALNPRESVKFLLEPVLARSAARSMPITDGYLTIAGC
jgi:hypothetical protein